ncbi:MAG: hypothetical protein KY458_14080 [Actinobacteria bacterium]|nr:hypothetical protein [Actinomycetota bacterium]
MATISAGNHPHGAPAPGHDHRPIATGPSGTDVPSADAARPGGPFTDHGPYRATATLPITSALDHGPYRATATLPITSALDHGPYRATATLPITSALDHDLNPSRHWHPAVPFPEAAVTGAAEAAKAVPC